VRTVLKLIGAAIMVAFAILFTLRSAAFV